LQNACAGVQSNASTQAFSWLQQTLSDARSANQKVWLMFHIPPGIDGYASTHPQGGPVPPVGEECLNDIVPMWVPEWTAKFDTLLESDQSTVVATFAGHTHTDDFRVFGTGSKSQFVLIDPPISPVYGQNPAFRLLDFSGGGEIQNYTTYYLTDLTAPDKNLHGKWKKEYRFSREWKAKEVNSTNLSRIYGEITSQDAAREQWLRLYNVSSDATKLPPNVARGLYCAIAELSVQGYGHCACHPPK